MRGSVLGFDTARGEGVIAVAGGERYRFRTTDWQNDLGLARAGVAVDFVAHEDGTAGEIFGLVGAIAGTSARGAYSKSPIAAGLLALFLGTLGVHKFYLGYSAQGITLLILWLVSWMLTIAVIGIFGLLAIGIVVLIEAIVYITKSPEEFNRIYVEGRRPWF